MRQASVVFVFCVLFLLMVGCSFAQKEQKIPQERAETSETKEVISQASGLQFYVQSEKDNLISIIDVTTNKVIGEIKTGKRPANIVFVEGKGFVTHRDGNTIGVIDLGTQKMTKEIKVGQDPHGIALSTDKKEIYVTTVGDQYIYVINSEKEEVDRTIDLGNGAKTNYPCVYGNRLYVTDHQNKVVYVIENDKLIDTYKVDGAPMVVKANGNGNLLYVATSNHQTITVFDTNTGEMTKEIKSGKDVTDFVISEDESLLVATNKDENSISIIDLSTDKIIKKVKKLDEPKHISFNEDESKVYFTMSGTNKVGVIDLKSMKLVDEIKVGRTPHGIQLNEME